MVLPFPLYFLTAYVLLPLAIRGSTKLMKNKPLPAAVWWYKVCPVVKCVPSLIQCIMKDEPCKAWLQDIAECDDADSDARQRSAATFSHVQHPHDVAFCRYQSFDRITSQTTLDFMECLGGSGCMEPSTYSDTCATLQMQTHRPRAFGPNLSPMLQGRWKKLYTTGWDIWPCQWTDFHRGTSKGGKPSIEAEPWMEFWPHTPNVWRMDLYWQNTVDVDAANTNTSSAITFHMCNEMYPKETWDFSELQPIQEQQNDDGTSPTPTATLKTRAVMWGTEAHENWYLIDANKKLQTMTVYYCAYTEAVQRFDSIAMVLQKEGAPTLTSEEHDAIRQQALDVLGPEHGGTLQRIPDCPRPIGL